MKIGLSEVELCVIVFCSLLFHSRENRTRSVCFEYKLTKQILLVGYPSSKLSSQRKLTLIHKPSAQNRQAVNQHDTARKTIKYLGINTLTHILAMHPFSTLRKHQKGFQMFSGDRERVHWERMG